MDKEDLYYQIARDRYMSQETQLHEFQRRAIQVISFGGLLLGLGMVYLRVEVANGEVSLSIVEPVVIVFLVMVAPFAYAAFGCMGLVRPKCWRHNPRPKRLGEILEDENSKDLTRWAGDEYTRSVNENQDYLDSAADMLVKATWLVTTQASLLVGLLVASLF